MKKTGIFFLIVIFVFFLIFDYHLYKQKKEADEIKVGILEQQQEEEALKTNRFLKYDIIKKEELQDNRVKTTILLNKNCTKKDAEKYMRACAKGYPGKQIIAYLNKNDKKPYAVYTFGQGDYRHAPVDEIHFNKKF